MTEADMHGHDHDVDFMDTLVSMLGALTFGGVGWAVGFGIVQAIQYGLTYFEIALPDAGLVASAISIGFVAFPILLGLFSAWRSYVKLISLD